MDKIKRQEDVIDPHHFYTDFWEILEGILNGVLFVMIGFVVLSVSISPYAAIIVPVALVALILLIVLLRMERKASLWHWKRKPICRSRFTRSF